MWNVRRCCDHCHWRSWLWTRWNIVFFHWNLWRVILTIQDVCIVCHCPSLLSLPFHSFCGSSTLKPQGFVSTGHELPVRIAAADQCQDGLDKASLLHEFGLFLNPRNCSQCFARVLSLSICSQHCCLDSFQIENPILSALPCSKSWTILVQSIFGGLFVWNSGRSAVRATWNLMNGLVSTFSGLSA